MKKCYILIGVPASGKSTWIESRLDKFNVLSSDNVIETVAHQFGFTYSEVFNELIKFSTKVFESDILKNIEIGADVAIDRTNLSPKVRKRFIDQFKKAGYEVTAVFFETPGVVEWDRRLRSRQGKFIPQDVLNSMANNLTYPSLDEGFDKIIDGNA